MPVDIHDNSDRTAYTLCFTCSGGDFPAGFEDELVKWHVKKCEMALLVQEGGPGIDKHTHYHSVGTFKTKKACNVKCQAETFYKKMKMDWNRASVVIKTVCVLVGAFGYCEKHQNERPPLLVMGWSLTWIRKQIVANLKLKPYKVVMEGKCCLTAKNATSMIIAYAKAKSFVLADKPSFTEVVCDMAQEGYQFEAVKIEWAYCQVMSMLGSRHAMRSMILNKLQFLD